MEDELSKSQEVVHGSMVVVENERLKRELVSEWQQKLFDFKSAVGEIGKRFDDISVLEDLVEKLEQSECEPPLFITWDIDGDFEYYHIEWSNTAILVGTGPSTTTGVFTSNIKTSDELPFGKLIEEVKKMF